MRSFRRAAASLLLVGIALFARADWTKVRQDFEGAKSKEAGVKYLSDHSDEIEENNGAQDLQELIGDFNSASTPEAKDSTYQSIKDLINANVATEHFSTAPGSEAKAKKIKSSNSLYKAERESSSSNWLQKIFERLKNIFQGNNSNNTPSEPPNVPEWIPAVVRGLFYVIVAAVVIGLIYLLTKIPWSWSGSKRTKKSRGGILEEGEELLTEDEYWTEANRLIAEGRYREACRALYLASLLRLDASRIARFEPTQTNWEHLRRIENSKTRPPELEFRATTKAYDHAWYGFTAKTLEDVAIFQETYLMIKTLTEAPQ